MTCDLLRCLHLRFNCRSHCSLGRFRVLLRILRDLHGASRRNLLCGHLVLFFSLSATTPAATLVYYSVVTFLQDNWVVVHNFFAELPREVLERLLLKLVMLIPLQVIYNISLVPLRVLIQCIGRVRVKL